MIDAVTIVITRHQVELIAIGDGGSVRELHALDGNYVLQNVGGNFEDEAVFGDNCDLVNAITNLAEPAGDICRQLIQQR